MSPPTPLELLAALLAGVTAAAASTLVLRPTRPLAGRVRPYTIPARTSLGRHADPPALADAGPVISGSTLRRLLGPPLLRLAERLGRAVERTGEPRMQLLLRQAGLFPGLDAPARLRAYRMAQLGSAAKGAAAGGGFALLLGQPAAVTLTLVGLGFAAGVSRWRGRLDRAITTRRALMRIELYTVNQQLAMHIRVGGGPVQALRRIAERADGAVADDTRDILRAHSAGQPIDAALQRAATLTPEPHAARTWRTLAAGAVHGSDLAGALLRLSEDVRDQRREDLKRAATKRRAAMLVPIIALMAPTMLLFILGPLPSIFFLGG